MGNAIKLPASDEWLVMRSIIDDMNPLRRSNGHAHWYPGAILPTAACGWTPIEASVVMHSPGDSFAASIGHSIRWLPDREHDRCTRCLKRESLSA